MYRFASGFICGLMGVAVFGLTTPEAGQTLRSFADDAVATSVNRAAKEDRLSSEMLRAPGAWKGEFNTQMKMRAGNEKTPASVKTPAQIKHGKMPVGCEPAVSTVLDDELAKIPSRCLAGFFLGDTLPG